MWSWNSTSARDLSHQFVLFFTHWGDRWGTRVKETQSSLAWSFTSILPLLQPACTFRSTMKFKCHGIDLSGNKFSQRQSLKKPSLRKGVLAHYNEGWKIQYASHSAIQNWFPIVTQFTKATLHCLCHGLNWGSFPTFFCLSFPVSPLQETILRWCLHLCLSSKAKQGRSASPILAHLHHILRLFFAPKKHIIHFILLLVKEELVANSKKSHLWNMPAPGLILPGALSSQFPLMLCFLQESAPRRMGLF